MNLAPIREIKSPSLLLLQRATRLFYHALIALSPDVTVTAILITLPVTLAGLAGTVLPAAVTTLPPLVLQDLC
ncbi:hypothetical protein [Tropheryma whipplei]|uniref:hypothetical protein n=1 Tax=Tropheryma whipplei TaxID=2039 RepID=UPI000313FBB0|nr:hypothetical protein [Tropheryma whipplei]